MKIKALITFLALSSLVLSGCSEYWWTRGQPPAPHKLYTKALSTLNQAKVNNAYNRAEVIELSNSIEVSLNGLISASKNKKNTRDSFAKLKTDFVTLESTLSTGSRAAYGELSGQLRALSKAKKINPATLELFGARTLFFMASEISVPAPKTPRA